MLERSLTHLLDEAQSMNSPPAMHTAGPWRQGRTLPTPETRRWSKAALEANERRERLMVFSKFSPFDGGRSRIRIAICEREEDARLIASAPDLRAISTELDRLMLVIESAVRHSDPKNHAAIEALILANRSIVEKAKGVA